MLRRGPALLLCAVVVGCDRTEPVPASEPSALEAPALPLAEALYAIDLPGPQARRVSLLLWLRSLELSPDQRQAFRRATLRVRAALTERDEALEALAERQARAQEPALRELERALVAGDPPPTVELAREDPRPHQVAYVLTALAEAEALVDAMGPEQRPGMANALFLLRPRVSHTEERGLLGDPWADGDFATMRRAGSGDQDPLDPGGLFTLGEGEEQLTAELDDERLVVLVALALEDAELVGALDALDGVEPPEEALAPEGSEQP